MMTVDLMVDDGGGPRHVRVPASFVLVRNGQGTPIAVAGEYGSTRSQEVASIQDPDFNQALRKLGVTDPAELFKLKT